MKSLGTDQLLAHTGKHLNIDVVCGMDVFEEECKHQAVYHETAYYFCSTNCQKHFDNYPERYVWDKA